MAPKPNGFMMFVFEWKGKYGKHMNMREATDQCGKIWEKMDANARAPYNEQAKRQKESGVSLKGGKKQEKLTCTGKPLKEVEREKAEAEQKERNMKRFTDLCVRNCRKDVKLLGEQKFYFLMVNYFTKTLGDGHYVPAEIAVAEFTLHDGVTRTYHSLINPDCDIFGLQYEAKHHADNTHGLPLPPNALGTTNLGKVYNDVLEFIYDPKSGEYPPVYTVYSVIPVVESVLGFLQSDAVAKNVDLRVYSIQYLMYILKEETCELGEIPKISESMIAVHFSNDFFEYQPGIGCQYHEDLDKSKYCAKSCVIRWGFMFADLMCNDIAIKLIPGRHCPAATNFNAVMEASGRKNTDADTQSQYSMQNDTISMVSMNTYVTEPLGGGDFNIDQDEWHEIGSTASKKNKQRRTANSSAGNRQAPRTNSFNEDHREVGVNSWASRGKQDAYISSVGMDMMRDRDMDDTASIISSNYGRGSIISNASVWSQGRGRGRGRGFPPLS